MRKTAKPAKPNPFRRVSNPAEDALLIMNQWAKAADEKVIKGQGRKGTAFPKDKR